MCFVIHVTCVQWINTMAQYKWVVSDVNNIVQIICKHKTKDAQITGAPTESDKKRIVYFVFMVNAHLTVLEHTLKREREKMSEKRCWCIACIAYAYVVMLIIYLICCMPLVNQFIELFMQTFNALMMLLARSIGTVTHQTNNWSRLCTPTTAPTYSRHYL